MASRGNWTVIFEDKVIIKQVGDGAGAYTINDNTFWNNSDYSNFWAVQYQTSNADDEVEFKDTTPNDTWASTGLDFQAFIDKWDAAHLAYLQDEWDNDNVDGETSEEKITRLGARPTSYSS